MSYELISFFVFATVTVAAALAVVLVKNPVYSVLSLVLTFFSTACLWLLLQAEFLGIVLVLVYVGAVMVLFLFVVMMLDIGVAVLREGFAQYMPVAVLVAIVMAIEMLTLIGAQRLEQGIGSVDPAAAAGLANTEWLARALFTDFLLPFEIAAVILTVALVAAIMLTLRRRTGTKHQKPSQQVQVRREDRVRLVKMASEPASIATPDDATAPDTETGS